MRSLTSLRFAAAGLVLAHHLAIFTPGLRGLSVLSAAGYVGVTFFFLLSGFVLTYSWKPGERPLAFYRRRFARIFPVHLVFLVIATSSLFGPQRWGAVAPNLGLVQAWWPSDAVAFSFNPVAWSLSCEAFFYLLLPLVIGRLMRVSKPLILAAALVAGALVLGGVLELQDTKTGLLLYHFPAFRVVEFLCGSLLAIAMSRGWRPSLRPASAAGFVTTSYLLVLVLPAFVGYRVADRWALSLLMAPAFLTLIAVCAHRDLTGASSWLQGPTLVSFGQWSYCLYMAHPFILVLTQPLLASASQAGAIVGCAIVVLAVLGVSYLTHVTVERPLERRLRGRTSVRLSGEPMSPEYRPPTPHPALVEGTWPAADADGPSAG